MRLPRLLPVAVSALLVPSPPLDAVPQVATPGTEAPQVLEFQARSRAKSAAGDHPAVTRTVRWDPRLTAVVICDMWDRHWCQGATRRVADMAPRMNAVVAALRRRGVLIIHCPSGTLGHYRGSPALALAAAAPAVQTAIALRGWCHLDQQREARLPIDDSDGGCDCQPRCRSGAVWKRQIATIEIAAGDAMSDSASAFYLMKQRGIRNVLVMGVHTNMCVLGRPFSIRQMVYQGQDVLLMRDLTDTMYNSRRPPFVDHHAGTDLVIEHIERHWCPTITSDQVLGGRPHRFADDRRPRLALVMAEKEYDTRRTLPALAASHLRHYRVSPVHVNPADPNDLPGLVGALADADVAVLSIRRRAPSTAQLQALRGFLARGGGLVGIRTTSHAFAPRDPVPAGHATWPAFDREVLGGHYQGHHGARRDGPSAHVRLDPTRTGHPILAGMPAGEQPVASSLYRHLPLASDAEPLLYGRTGDAQPHQPVAWTRRRPDGGRVFYTSLGHPQDFEQEWFRGLLARGIAWAARAGRDAGAPQPGTPTGRNPAPATPAPRAAEPPAPKRRQASWAPGARTPAAALAAMRTPADLAVDLVLAEPTIAQPVHLGFDARGRLWVVEYRQYPHPAGLRITSRDRIWRNVYDRVPPPPPHAIDSPFRGADRISIHTDTNGDGRFDRSKVFLDGLNMCTAVAQGDGGVWVLNPPYLLFYPDRDRDDVPDGDGRPIVHLRGFWLEDSHSIANSLCQGPDGWLYGAQGSTVTADIEVVGRPGPPIHTQGQQIWRYHPRRRVFEVFAEGGGNAFGCEIDAKGRVFSGHNGGNTRGFHYPQGGYLRKGFNKHGPLSNPYAFGYFPHMPHNQVARFSHSFIVYEGDALPADYRGRIFAVDPINRYVPIAARTAEGATFRTEDLAAAIRTDDQWFRPVDIKHGPDGAIYLCDWYDAQINHYRNHEGRIDKQNGRIYRIRGKRFAPRAGFDLATLGPDQLIDLLAHPNRWHREQARRLLARHRQPATHDRLARGLRQADGGLALECLWALHGNGGLTEDLLRGALRHADPHVRAWAVRLIGDAATPPVGLRQAVSALAADERHPVVRSQLAATARRLPAGDCLAVFDRLTRRDLDRADRYLPLQLWWALESKCAEHGDRVLAAFTSPAIWSRPIVREQILWRLMRRFAATGQRRDLLRCARLLRLAPDQAARRLLMDGFEQAFRGRPMDDLPAALTAAIEAAGIESVVIDIRRGKPGAVTRALRDLADPQLPLARRSTCAYLLAETGEPRTVAVLLDCLAKGQPPAIQPVALRALQSFAAPQIGTAVLAAYPRLPEPAAEVARVLLTARTTWAGQLLDAIAAGGLDAGSFAAEDVARLRLRLDDHPAQLARVDRVWGKLRPPAPAHLRREIDRIKALVLKGAGDPYRGKQLFLQRCAVCHRLFGDGADLGPDLTTFQRSDLDAMVLAVVHPDAEIREGYERVLVSLRDGRMIVGSKADEDDRVVVVRGADGRLAPLARAQIGSIEPVAGSLMPSGLLRDLSDRQLQDLFGYLRTTQPQIR